MTNTQIRMDFKVKKMKFCKISALGLVLLSACTPDAAKWTPTESPKENTVDRTVSTYTIPYAVCNKEWNCLEKGKFLNFLKDSIPRPYAVRITLEEYGGHSEKRLKDIERELLRYGVPLDLIHRNYDHVDDLYEVYQRYKYQPCNRDEDKNKAIACNALNSVVVVVVEQFVVIPPSCANFLEHIGDASQAYTSSNFGCSTEVNLGMMIANPLDLLRGRARGGYDGTVLAAGVNRYETDNIKPIVQIITTTMQQNATGNASGTGGGTGGGSGGY